MTGHRTTLVGLLRRWFPDGFRLGVEVGVAAGNTSRMLLEEFPDLHLVLVDPWDFFVYPFGDENAKAFKRDKSARSREAIVEKLRFAKDRVIILHGFSPQVTEMCKGGFDFVYIDGDHHYEAVKADMKAWWPLVRPHGIMCGHDYGYKGGQAPHHDVDRAVNEFMYRMGLQLNLEENSIWWTRKLVMTTV